jgi:phenylalanyl-tRNA synthetase beta chain
VKVPLSWLRDYVDVDLSAEELAERLTLLGMEVKGIEQRGSEWRSVVVGELLEVGPHPRADRLSLTRVTVGDGEAPLDIVCGATNIAVGQRVPVALPGAVLPGDRRIERTEKMGVVSNGMLCSGDELRLTADADGILILAPETPLGRPIADLFGDVVLDVDVKPNRGDALSLVGLAREVAAATGATVRWPETDPEEAGPTIADRLSVEVEAPDLCPRFVGRWVSGVAVRPSPDWVQMRLLAAGMRPVSNVVDASNYTMLELGKPVHTFDAASLARDGDGRAAIVVRRARSGERLETLDHVMRDLDPETLVVTDPNGPVGIAGVMGGADSEVGEGTTDVVVESAIFDPVAIRRTGHRYALRSEASLRFEKGQEFRLARIGADRCAGLVAEWAGGKVSLGRVDTNPSEPERATVTFRPERVNRLLGTDLDEPEQRAVLARVGLEVEVASPGDEVTIALEPQPVVLPVGDDFALTALVPTWRRDITIEADVAEEIARVRGYDAVPSTLPDTVTPAWRPAPLEVRDHVRALLVGAGLTEVVTYALVSPAMAEAFALRAPVASTGREPAAEGERMTVTNPLSRDHSVLRQGLIGSLVEVVGTNVRHGREDVAIFETGKGYAKDGDRTREWWRLGFALTGAADAASWNRPARAWDLDDAKGLIELLCRGLGLEPPAYTPEISEGVLHPGRALRATAAGPDGPGLEAVVGELHPSVVQGQGLRTDRLIVAELSLAGLEGGRLADVRTQPPPRHPSVERDLAIIVAESRPAAEVAAVLRAAGGELLRTVVLFDIYRGAPLGDDEKSLAHRLTFGADRTLTESEVDAAITSITAAIERDLGGRLRT